MWALSCGASFGRYSSRGSSTYVASGANVDISQTLSADHLGVYCPVSARLGPKTALYSGLHYWHSSVVGTADTTYVSAVTNDVGMNLGVRLNFGKIEGDVELMMVRMYDPFQQGYLIRPYLGLSAGISF
jgi:hypothetical protein